ncbi:hypothetical protein [Microbulbifer spongiae]|uniref:Uncharacterized protein n=1 Tax=Microbulbifer spongiae TaxID=2944933 RepID=A0ABY9E7D1_9GAMM|nr:hypothetical protein [Microbulbifer sp. MI-G]WKD48928.1 hypothetical protein M8T91_13630 [Microbulbifer sp. MI-G]
MNKVIVGALLACVCSPALAQSVLSNTFRAQCTGSDYKWIEKFDISDIYPANSATGTLGKAAVYFGNNDTGEVYQLFVDESSPDSIRTVQTLTSTVNAGLATDKTVDLCIDQSTTPHSVMAINFIKEATGE